MPLYHKRQNQAAFTSDPVGQQWAKRAFLISFWKNFLPRASGLTKAYDHVLPSIVIDRLPKFFTYDEVLPFLEDDSACQACFIQAVQMIEQQWDQFSAIGAITTIEAMEDNGLSQYFDLRIVGINRELYDFQRMRLDVADVIFTEMRQEIDQKLENLHVYPDEDRPVLYMKSNENKILQLFYEIVKLRGDVDLSMMMVLNAKKTKKLIGPIEGRTRDFYYNLLTRLRNLLKISTTFYTPHGIYPGSDLPNDWQRPAAESVENRLDLFKNLCDEYIENIEDQKPALSRIAKVKHLMETFGMTQQNTGGNTYNFNGNTIGVFNTGTIETIHKISQSVDLLKSRGEVSVADALAAVTKQVSESLKIAQEADRAEILEQIEALGKIASEPKAETPGGVVKALVKSLAASLIASSLKDVWDQHGQVITDFFGVTLQA